MRPCPSCGEENPDKAKFCLECATPLPEQPARATREERKTVSIVFCDLVGFTEASERADPEDVRARLIPYHARVKRELEALDGTVEKFIGDAVMAVFGAPIAHEDDAERAVRASLRILEAIDEMNEADPSLRFAVRIAVNSGETLVALDARPELGEAMVTGDVVNTASRLQGAAPVGSVVVGEDTHRATEPIFLFEELDPVELKGKAEPVRLWQALEARSRFGVDIMRAPTTPFVGRDDDLALLTSLYGRAHREGSVQLVTLVGEPGVGKSRLVAEFGRTLDERPELITWRQGRCLPYGEGIAFWALGEIVKAQAGILESDSVEVAKDKLGTVLEVPEDERAWMVQRLAPLLGADSLTSVEREETFTAWRRFLEAIASKDPAVFVIEDLHWADAPMIEFLEHVAEWSEQAAMLIVCTARPEFFERYPGWAGGRRNALTIGLSPLSDADTARLVQALLEQVVLPAELQTAILDRAGGNPLYAEEFVRMLTDRGLLETRGRTVALREDAEIPVPDSIHALIAGRIDTLAPDRKALLQDASVLGKVFWSGAVQAMGGRDTQSVQTALHELANKELVRPAKASSMGGEAEFAFWHAMVRDVTYSQIPRASRAHKHLAAARWIETAAPERPKDVADILIHHYDEAIALDGDEATVEAVYKTPLRQALVFAGERATWTDIPHARRCFERGLELTDDDRERATILTKLGSIIERAGDLTGAIDRLEAGVMAARAAEDPVAEAAALIFLYRASSNREGGTSETFALLERAISMLEDEGPTLELARAYQMMSNAVWILARFEEAVEWADKAMRAADGVTRADPDELRELRGSVLCYRGFARLLWGDEQGREDAERGIDELRAAGTLDAITLLNYGEALWPSAGPGEALLRQKEGQEVGRRTGAGFEVLAATDLTQGPLFDLGEWGSATEAGREVRRLNTDEDWVASMASGKLASIAALEGDLDAARPLAADVSASLARIEETQFRAIGLAAVAIEADLAGRTEEAATAVRELASSPDLRADWYYVWRLPMMLRICVRAGELELAESLLEGVRPVPIGHEHVMVACRAILAEARGEIEEAEGIYAEAADRWASFPSVPERGFALLGRGRCLLELGRIEAVASLRDAREIFVDLGARPAAEETDALLARATALSS